MVEFALLNFTIVSRIRENMRTAIRGVTDSWEHAYRNTGCTVEISEAAYYWTDDAPSYRLSSRKSFSVLRCEDGWTTWSSLGSMGSIKGFYKGVASQRFEGKKNAPTDVEVLLGAFAKLREATISCVSVRSHGTTPLTLEGFRLNLICKLFLSKICRESSSFIKIWQE